MKLIALGVLVTLIAMAYRQTGWTANYNRRAAERHG